MMSGVQAQALGVSNGAVNGARAAYAIRAPGIQEHTTVNKHTRTSSPRGLSKGSISRVPLTSVAANGKPTDPNYPQPGGRANTGAIANSGSEADGQLDLYGRSDIHKSLGGVDSDIPENMYKPEENDPEGWIHRDKLAKIESEELQAAGINLANARRTMSKTGRRGQSHSRDTSEAGSGVEPNPRPIREEKQYHRTPPVAEDPGEEERKGWDLRTPEEIAADEARSQHPLRKTGSRIPILTSSPLPIPAERVERDTPLPRKRTLSGSMSPDDVIPAPKIRLRQTSSGSGMILDDREAVSSPGAAITSSPSRSKTAKGSATASPATIATKKGTPHTRKVSTTVKPSGASSPSQQRPVTKAGEGDRPRTAVNRPEGDAPWLATMYKPDPRLPPDQQIIPTHARKQQQAQWTEEGAVPSTYDREFTPLAVHTAGGLVQLPAPAAVVEKPNDQEAWPLKPMPSVRSNNSAGRPGTSGSQTAGYSTMPKVSMRSPVSSVAPSPVRNSFPSAPVRMQQQQSQSQQQQPRQFDAGDQAGKAGSKEKGCLSCCVIM